VKKATFSWGEHYALVKLAYKHGKNFGTLLDMLHQRHLFSSVESDFGFQFEPFRQLEQ
jgi:hypothetical protein